MSRNTPLLAAAALLVSLATAQAAEPLRLTDSQLDQVTAGAAGAGVTIGILGFGNYTTGKTNTRSFAFNVGNISVAIGIGKGFGLAVDGGTDGSATGSAYGDHTTVQSQVINAHGGPISTTVATAVTIAVSGP